MTASLTQLIICPHCGSTEYLVDYPTPGKRSCAKCIHECTEITLKTIESYDKALTCPFCREKGKDDEMLFDVDDKLVYKCKKCGRLSGYYVEEPDDPLDTLECDDDYDPIDLMDDCHYSCKEVGIAQREGKPTLSTPESRRTARTLEEQRNDPRTKCRKQLNLLIEEKSRMIETTDPVSRIIDSAVECVERLIQAKNSYTKKQLAILLSAAIVVVQEKLLRKKTILKKEFTERQVQELFDVDRKTIRKWKKALEERHRRVKLWIITHQEGSPQAHINVEFPRKTKSIVKLNASYDEKCDFCEELKPLDYRINYFDKSWSHICTSCYEMLKDSSLEHGWETDRRIFLS